MGSGQVEPSMGKCAHCGWPLPPRRAGRTPQYCSSRCRTRGRRHLPYVGKRNWKPTHPVDVPVYGVCAALDCHEELHRRGQTFCSVRCRVAVKRIGFTAATLRRTDEQMEARRRSLAAQREQARIDRMRKQTLKNDAIDRCAKCDDDGILPSGVEHWHPIG